MLTSSSRGLALFTVVLLAACQGTPQPAPEPMLEPILETAPEPAPRVEMAPPPEPLDLDQRLYQQALQTLRTGDAETALIALEQLGRDAPEKPYLFTNIGLAHFKLQQMEAAELAFIEAISRNPDDAVAHNHLGILKRRNGEFEEALRHYRRAIEIDAGYAAAHLNLGILFDLYLQNLEMALQQYQNYRSLSDGDNTEVDGWIVDIERRLKTAES